MKYPKFWLALIIATHVAIGCRTCSGSEPQQRITGPHGTYHCIGHQNGHSVLAVDHVCNVESFEFPLYGHCWTAQRLRTANNATYYTTTAPFSAPAPTTPDPPVRKRCDCQTQIDAILELLKNQRSKPFPIRIILRIQPIPQQE